MTQDSNRREACVAQVIATTSRVVGKKEKKKLERTPLMQWHVTR